MTNLVIPPPPELSLIQWREGEVAIQPRQPSQPDDNNYPDPSATHYRVYLSQSPGELGTLAATITPIYTPDGPATFQVPVGTVSYATVHTYNSNNGGESDNTEQYRLQMYELLHLPYTITCFFHEPSSPHEPHFPQETTWAIGVSPEGDQVGLLQSNDYFSTWKIASTWTMTDLNPYHKDFPGFSNFLTFYIDKFGHKYISARPLPLICRAGTDIWAPIADSQEISFTTPESALLVGGWSIAEDDGNMITFAEYGEGDPHSPLHHTVLMSTDPERISWTAVDFPGNYRHIHCYLINPYNTQVHLLSLGDAINDEHGNAIVPGDTGLFISTDGGKSWGTNVLATLDDYHNNFYNGPCTATFYPDQETLIINDTHSQWAYLWSIGKNGWQKIENGTSLVYEIYQQLQWYEYRANSEQVYIGYPITPWSGSAVEGTYETYCTALGYYDGDKFQHAPEPLFRVDNVGAESMVIAATRDFGNTLGHGMRSSGWKMISYSRGNVIPSTAKYVFSTMLGGMRIPREVS